MKEQLAALYALQQQDSKLEALKRQFALLDSGKAEKTAYDAADAADKEAAAALSTASGELKDTELEQEQVETKRKEYETKLYSGKVTNPKELQAMQDEVEMLGRMRTKLEDKVLVLTEQVENRKKEHTVTSSAAKKSKAALKAKIAAYKAIAESVRVEAQEVVDQRQTFVTGIPAPLLKRYDVMRTSKAGIAIVNIEDKIACGGCKMALPSSLITRVREGSNLEYCQNCGRILCDVASTKRTTP